MRARAASAKVLKDCDGPRYNICAGPDQSGLSTLHQRPVSLPVHTTATQTKAPLRDEKETHHKRAANGRRVCGASACVRGLYTLSPRPQNLGTGR